MLMRGQNPAQVSIQTQTSHFCKVSGRRNYTHWPSPVGKSKHYNEEGRLSASPAFSTAQAVTSFVAKISITLCTWIVYYENKKCSAEQELSDPDLKHFGLLHVAITEFLRPSLLKH